MEKDYIGYYKSKIGLIEIKGNKNGIKSLEFIEKELKNILDTPPELKDIISQIDEYFSGKRKRFTLNTIYNGTGFQKEVWEAIKNIPYGKTATYSDIARQIGKENAMRAIGHTNANNKILIVIPCHRVVGKNASLRGYRGGFWRKEWLLNHEKKT